MSQPVKNVELLLELITAWAMRRTARRAFIPPERLESILDGSIVTDDEMLRLCGALHIKDIDAVFGEDRRKSIVAKIAHSAGVFPKVAE